MKNETLILGAIVIIVLLVLSIGYYTTQQIKELEQKINSIQPEIIDQTNYIVGSKGESGQDGEKGLRGKTGEDGKDGKDGQDGQQGPKGEPGESTTDEDFLEYYETMIYCLNIWAENTTPREEELGHIDYAHYAQCMSDQLGLDFP